MTPERATEFGTAWNSRDADLVASYFTDDGVYHASVGPDALGKSYFGKDDIRPGAQAFLDRFPDGRFENLKVVSRVTSERTSSRLMGTANLYGRLDVISSNSKVTKYRRRTRSGSSAADGYRENAPDSLNSPRYRRILVQR